MCGRAIRTTPTGNLARHFRAEAKADLGASFNIAPTRDVAVVRRAAEAPDAGESQTRELIAARWGLLPPWAKDDAKKRPPTLTNAKAETLGEKPTFKRPFEKRRCLVIFDGFYEWRTIDKKDKRPHLIRLKSHEPMAMAGLWEHNRSFQRDSTIVITTDANALVSDIHDRMPVILPDEDAWRTWLDPETDEETLKSMLAPCDPGLLEMVEVSKHVNSVKNDDARCIEPLTFDDGRDEVRS